MRPNCSICFSSCEPWGYIELHAYQNDENPYLQGLTVSKLNLRLEFQPGFLLCTNCAPKCMDCFSPRHSDCGRHHHTYWDNLDLYKIIMKLRLLHKLPFLMLAFVNDTCCMCKEETRYLFVDGLWYCSSCVRCKYCFTSAHHSKRNHHCSCGVRHSNRVVLRETGEIITEREFNSRFLTRAHLDLIGLPNLLPEYVDHEYICPLTLEKK